MKGVFKNQKLCFKILGLNVLCVSWEVTHTFPVWVVLETILPWLSFFLIFYLFIYFFYKCVQCCHIISHQSPCPLSLIGQTYLSLSSHHGLHHCEDWLVHQPIQMSKNFSLFISVVVYVDTAAAWSNDSPVFFSFSHLHRSWKTCFIYFSH